MSTVDTTSRTDRHQAGLSVLTRAAQGALVVLTVALVCLLAPSLASDAAGRPPSAATSSSSNIRVHEYQLGPGIWALVYPDASVRIQSQTPSVTEGLLSVEILLPEHLRAAAASQQLFSTVVSEGAPAGQRGFARDADDDGDGVIDEDRLDGRDNDGDGRIDEDYAAISDAMAVVDLGRSGQFVHLESYHWPYANVRNTMVLNYRAEDTSGQALSRDLSLQLSGGRWQRSAVVGRFRQLGSRETHRECIAFVSGRSDPSDPTRQLWLGLTMLEEPLARAKPSTRMYVERDLIQLPLLEGEVRLALCVAPTFLQLSTQLAAAHAVHEGAADPVTGRSAGWIVPPQLPADGPARSTPARWYPGDPRRPGDAGGQLVLAFQPGHDDPLDPDLFVLDSQPLGPPESITWMPAQSEAVRIDWRQPQPNELRDLPAPLRDPYGQLYTDREQELSGHLVFHFAGGPQIPRYPRDLAGAVERGVTAVTLAGEMTTLAVEWVETSVTEAGPGMRVADGPGSENALERMNQGLAATTDSGGENVPEETVLDAKLESDLRSGRQRPSLNPELLQNYPNPFRDVTTFSFTVPATVEEGFVWEDGQTALLEPQSAMPYRNGQPLVSVRVYSINGQELATLFAEYTGTGQYQASWDGTDVLGRPVASGTYFCKLQIENWSVTRRLVFLR